MPQFNVQLTWSSTERRSHRIRNDQLIIGFKALPVNQYSSLYKFEKQEHTLQSPPTPSSNPGAKTLLT